MQILSFFVFLSGEHLIHFGGVIILVEVWGSFFWKLSVSFVLYLKENVKVVSAAKFVNTFCIYFHILPCWLVVVKSYIWNPLGCCSLTKHTCLPVCYVSTLLRNMKLYWPVKFEVYFCIIIQRITHTLFHRHHYNHCYHNHHHHDHSQHLHLLPHAAGDRGQVVVTACLLSSTRHFTLWRLPQWPSVAARLSFMNYYFTLRIASLVTSCRLILSVLFIHTFTILFISWTTLLRDRKRS